MELANVCVPLAVSLGRLDVTTPCALRVDSSSSVRSINESTGDGETVVFADFDLLTAVGVVELTTEDEVREGQPVVACVLLDCTAPVTNRPGGILKAGRCRGVPPSVEFREAVFPPVK